MIHGTAPVKWFLCCRMFRRTANKPDLPQDVQVISEPLAPESDIIEIKGSNTSSHNDNEAQ